VTFDISRIQTKFDALCATDQGTVCGYAFCFLQAVRETAPEGVNRHEAPRPDFDDLTRIVPGLGVPALLFQEVDFVRDVTEDPYLDRGQISDGRGAVLLFEDLTALWCNPRVLSENEIDLTHADAEFTMPFHRDHDIVLHAASDAFTDRFGPAADWYAALPDMDGFFEIHDEDLIGVLSAEVEDLIDPPIESVDMRPQENWDAADIATLEADLALAWAATGATCGVNLEITAADPDGETPHEKEISLLDESGQDACALVSAFGALLDAALVLDRFQGAVWEYNDGAHGRLSGFSRFPPELLSIEIMPGDGQISNHKRLGARPILEDRMRARGVAENDIAEIFKRLDAAVAGQADRSC